MISRNDNGILLISLDFELFWGTRDSIPLADYRENIFGAHEAVKKILSVFNSYGIHATWAIVGFVFFKDLAHLKTNIPKLLPDYENKLLSPYGYINEMKQLDEQLHFAPQLVQLIRQTNGQEIGSHSFSHYYCLEEGPSLESFKEDVSSCIRIADSDGIKLSSFVFPKNQSSRQHIDILNQTGFSCYRGNEKNWIYKSHNTSKETLLRRFIRFTDNYINLSGHHTYTLESCCVKRPYNFPASRFLRPYSKSLSCLDTWKRQRIVNAMKDAACHNKIFHMWWHPHNFGKNTDQNLAFLETVLDHFRVLEREYGMKSFNMRELAQTIDERTT